MRKLQILFTFSLLLGWTYQVQAQSSLQIGGFAAKPTGQFEEMGYEPQYGVMGEFLFRDGPKILGFEIRTGVRLSYSWSESQQLAFSRGISYWNESAGGHVVGRLISPRMFIRAYGEFLVGTRYHFSSTAYDTHEPRFAQVSYDSDNLVTDSWTFSYGWGAGVRIRISHWLSMDMRYNRLKGSPTQFMQSANNTFPQTNLNDYEIVQSDDSNVDWYSMGLTLTFAERKNSKRYQRKKQRREREEARRRECERRREPAPAPRQVEPEEEEEPYRPPVYRPAPEPEEREEPVDPRIQLEKEIPMPPTIPGYDTPVIPGSEGDGAENKEPKPKS